MRTLLNTLLLTIFCLFIYSCDVINPFYHTYFKTGIYKYEYLNDEKKIDFRKGNWLLASNDIEQITFFKKYLGNRLTLLSQAKNKSNQYLYPFKEVDLKITEKQLLELTNSTNYNYLITIQHATNMPDKKMFKTKEQSVVNIYDLSSGSLKYQIICSIRSDINESRLIGIDTQKKLYQKINKHAKH